MEIRPAAPAALMAAALFVGAGCGDGGSADYVVLDASDEPLRSAFAADSGSVRVLIVAGPT